jgi:hypothetical protein
MPQAQWGAQSDVKAPALEAELATVERRDGVIEVIVERLEDRAADAIADEMETRAEQWADERY